MVGVLQLMKNKITSFAHSPHPVSCDTVEILKIVNDLGVVKLLLNHLPELFSTTSHDKGSDNVDLAHLS